ncbi:RING-H2 finger protein ATL16-like [Phalaenopsis equestris]|uniref:RING-H2 finger protein ATL16-like n=1 Tax=Phalaenopsis equestris TaxID=78828 RepID=UPI0009E41CFC|nr:RING-H2 finger protein ATL16-like [Phalaenopsis equestris]
MSSLASASSSPSSSSSMSFPIVVIAIVGILGTAAFLLIYYIFVIKCCLNIRISEPDRILRRISRSRRRLQGHFSFTSASAPIERGHGLDPSAIRSIPTFRYSSAAAPLAAECAVCLLEFRENERLRRLAGCGHAFHIDCIDTWLESNASCRLHRHRARVECELPALSGGGNEFSGGGERGDRNGGEVGGEGGEHGG